MRKIIFTSGRSSFLVLLTLFTLTIASAARAQCYESLSVYQINPYGALCSPQNATLMASVNGYGGYVSGEFRWYTDEWSYNPIYTQNVSQYDQAYGYYTFYASPGQTVWLSFYNYNTGCESYRTSYTFAAAENPPVLYQEYGKVCSNNVAIVQLSSTQSDVVYDLYKIDNYSGYYNYISSNTSGYFEIANFNSSERQNYYCRVSPQGGSCSNGEYYQLYFDDVTLVIAGPLEYCQGRQAQLTAIGYADRFQWFNASGTLLGEGVDYVIPAGTAPGTYSYTVKGISNGSCDPGTKTTLVTINPKPVDGTISSSAATIYLGQSVTISSQAETGYSNTHTVTVYPALQAGSINPVSQNINYMWGAQQLILSGVSGGNGSYSYQWQMSATSSFTEQFDILGATSPTYTPPSSTAGAFYYRVRVNSNGVTAYSK